MGAHKLADKSMSGWRPLWRLIQGRSWTVALLAVVSFVGATSEAGVLVLITTAGVTVAEQESVVQVRGLELTVDATLAFVAALLAIRLLLAIFDAWLASRLTVGALSDLRVELASAYFATSWKTQQSEPSGRLQELMTNVASQAAIASINAFTQWLTALLNLVAFLVAAFFVDLLATVFVLAAVIVLALVLRPIRYLIRRYAGNEVRSSLEFSNAVSELGGLGFEMQAYGVQDGFKERVVELNRKNINARLQRLFTSLTLSPIYMTLAYSGVLLGILFLTQADVASLGALGAVLVLMLRSLTFGQTLQANAGTIAGAMPYAVRVEDAVVSYKEGKATGGEEIPKELGGVELDSVTFEYSPGDETLRKLSLRIEPNEIIGVIGPSGAGKSTLVQLLLGLRDPTSGIVRVSGTALETVDREWLSARTAMVAQDAILFTGTVAENVRFFRENIGDEEIREALEAANLLDVVEALPEGIQTHLGERGSQLSGGQRQRLSIARALAGRPSLLVMDEPTSALDVKSEALIREAILRMKGRTTVIVIAHRLSVLSVCDKILVIENGQATGFAEPDVLAASNEFFKNATAMSDARLVGQREK